LYFKEII